MNGQQPAQPQTCEHWVENLEDGSAVLIRPLREEDHERDKRFLSTIAYESRRFRFIAGLSGGLPNGHALHARRLSPAHGLCRIGSCRR